MTLNKAFSVTAACLLATSAPAETLLPVLEAASGKCGFTNEKLQWKTGAYYDEATPFKNGMAVIYVNGKAGVLKSDFSWNIQPQLCDHIDLPFVGGYARAFTNGRVGLVDESGRFVINPVYSLLQLPDQVSTGTPFLIAATLPYPELRGIFIDIRGNTVLDKGWMMTNGFQNGYASVFDKMPGLINRKVASLIDHTGKSVLPDKYDSLGSYSEGLISFGTHPPSTESMSQREQFEYTTSGKPGYKEGFLDISGKVVIPPQFDEANNFKGGLAAVKINEKWGYIDKTGRIVITPQFYQANDFDGEYAEVVIGKEDSRRQTLIRKDGQLAFRPDFSYIRPIPDSDCFVFKTPDYREGIIRATGQVLFPPVLNQKRVQAAKDAEKSMAELKALLASQRASIGQR